MSGRRRGGHPSTGPAITEIDLNKVDWAASVAFNDRAAKVLEWACGPQGPFQSSVANDRDGLMIISQSYWPQEDLEAAAQAVDCTSQEVLDVILTYRE